MVGDVFPVVYVCGDMVAGIYLVEEGVESGVVALQVVGSLETGCSVIELEVRPEPPLCPFRPVFGDGIDRILAVV